MNKGISLIEMMIVIAIIAFGAAAAVPAYTKYTFRSKMGTAKIYASSFNPLITSYYTDHGTFPTNTILGVSSTVPTSVSGYIKQPYVAYILFSPQSTSGTQCSYTKTTAYISNYAGDHYANATFPYIMLNIYFIDHKGTMVTMCDYTEFLAVTASNIFPSCIDMVANPSDTTVTTYVNTACV
ncbi:MAG TPA: prepilin-type N-terminal cleavage/methylation domain-containing protein [Gammaproteobacteria bacterium]|nr:prepilin-type N-terminal cleavage/methylation domain-containing protein [Gammaproteobacteria bacterium]